MNCNHFQAYLTDLLAGELPPEVRARLEAHAAECPACAAAWAEARRAVAAVTPTAPVSPAADFRARVLEAVRRQEAAGAGPAASSFSLRRRRLLRWMAGGLSAAAVIAVALTVGLHTPLRAARQSLRQALVSMRDVRQVAVHFRVRTDPQENFAYTDARLDLLPHTLQVVYAPEMVWRLEKADRAICSDGKTLYQWLPDLQQGWISAPADSAAMLLQLDPRLLLMREQEAAVTAQNAVYRVERTGNEVRLTVTAPARGNFAESDYMRNTSIAESDTRREYRFDAGTGRLLGGRILLLTPQGERTIVAIDRIDYDAAIDTAALMERPEAVDWIDMRRPMAGNRLAGIGAAEAGRLILQAFRTWDPDVLDEALFYYGESSHLLRDRYAGAVVVEIADPVRSGLYPGLFIPCKLRLSDGTAVRLMLALRNDNPQGVWVVDGGL